MSQAVALAAADAPALPSGVLSAHLTGRQRRFADNWLAEPNGTRAAAAAGYKAPAEEAWHLLRLPKVVAYINARIREGSGVGVPRLRHDIVERLHAIATADLRDILSVERNADGIHIHIKPSCEWGDRIAQAIAEVVGQPAGTKQEVRVKLHNKLEALDKLARITGLIRREPSGFGYHVPLGGGGPPLQVAEVRVSFVTPDHEGWDIEDGPSNAHLGGHTSAETTGRGVPLSDRQPKPGGCPGK